MIRRGWTRPALLALSAWLVGAATAVAVGLLALSSVGAGLTGGPADPLAQAPIGATPVPAPGPSQDPSITPAAQSFSSIGGTVEARCVEGGPYLEFWTPAQGYHAKDVVRGPAERARVKFESRNYEVVMTITCVGGVPQSTVKEEWEDDAETTAA